MFDPDLIEKRKAEMEKKKQAAMARVKLPPLTGNHSKPGEQVSLDNLMSPDDAWLALMKESELVRNGHGIRSVKGKWEIFDLELYERRVDAVRRELLNAVWQK